MSPETFVCTFQNHGHLIESDAVRAHIPEDVEYNPKWALALEMIEHAVQTRVPRGVVLADCDYGTRLYFANHASDHPGA